MNNYFKKAVNLINRVSSQKIYRKLFLNGYIHQPDDIFDYHYIIQQRETPNKEIHTSSKTYGIGYQFRRATGYNKPIRFLVEHSINSVRVDNTTEYLENEFPMVLTPSRARWELLQPRTHKLVIPYGPNTMPYAREIYNEYMLAAVKQNLGKTLVVYPQHNNSEFSYFETQNLIKEFVDYIEKFKEEHHFDTVLCCMYFRDIQGCAHVEFEKKGWKIVSCGHNMNYDFGDCSKTIYRLADFVIAQGSYATNIQATYMGVPSISLPGNRQSVNKDGSIRDANVVMGDGPIFKECDELFNRYMEEITPEQKAWATKWGGFDNIKTPEEIALLLDYAKDVYKCDMKDATLLKVANKAKYAPIRSYIQEALDTRMK